MSELGQTRKFRLATGKSDRLLKADIGFSYLLRLARCQRDALDRRCDLQHRLENSYRKVDANRRDECMPIAMAVFRTTWPQFINLPLKSGCRTLPSADFARYSISARSSGST